MNPCTIEFYRSGSNTPLKKEFFATREWAIRRFDQLLEKSEVEIQTVSMLEVVFRDGSRMCVVCDKFNLLKGE